VALNREFHWQQRRQRWEQQQMQQCVRKPHGRATSKAAAHPFLLSPQHGDAPSDAKFALAHAVLCCAVQVAIKKMKRKFFSWEECMALREVSDNHCLCSTSHCNAVLCTVPAAAGHRLCPSALLICIPTVRKHGRRRRHAQQSSRVVGCTAGNAAIGMALAWHCDGRAGRSSSSSGCLAQGATAQRLIA
jgi:hypothetical protein